MIPLLLSNEDLQSLSRELMLIAGIIRTWFQNHAAKSTQPLGSFKQTSGSKFYWTLRNDMPKPQACVKQYGIREIRNLGRNLRTKPDSISDYASDSSRSTSDQHKSNVKSINWATVAWFGGIVPPVGAETRARGEGRDGGRWERRGGGRARFRRRTRRRGVVCGRGGGGRRRWVAAMRCAERGEEWVRERRGVRRQGRRDFLRLFATSWVHATYSREYAKLHGENGIVFPFIPRRRR
jgi:hypothetical protein